MSKNDLKQPDFEHDLQRYMQIREQVHEEIKKIGTHVATLESTNKRLVAHFDVFKEMGKRCENQIYEAIKAAAFQLNHEAERVFSPLIEKLLREKILKLGDSIDTARDALEQALYEKAKRPLYYTFMRWSLLVAIGFGIGSLVVHCNTPVVPKGLTQEIELLQHKVNVLLNNSKQEPQKKEMGKKK